MNKCEHNRVKIMCRDCGGSQFCEHNRRKCLCRECGGASICEHNKERTKCRECKGGSLCEHNKRRSGCKDCNGGSICEHDKTRSHCKVCKGSQICEHSKLRSICKDCKGGSICEHNKQKRYCKQCGGSCICEHNKQKNHCKKCNSVSICEHDKIKSNCRECGGLSFCEHGKRKTRCKLCGGSQLCKTPLCETRGTKKYNGYCMPCCIHMCPEITVSRNYKTKEREVSDKIKESFPDFEWVLDKRVDGGCSKRRPDLLLDLGTHIIIIEVDENKHTTYDCSCENKRLMELSRDLGHRPIVFIRFNPDGYVDSTGKKIISCWRVNGNGIMTIMKTRQKEWDYRISSLKDQVKYWIENTTEKTVEIVELYY